MEMNNNELILRPLNYEDYESWLKGFNNRRDSQNKFDDGKLDMSICTFEWFKELVDKHQIMIRDDYQYIYGVFNERGENLGFFDVVILERANFQWCEIGYFIHNQYWRKGYAYKALKILLHKLKHELDFHRCEAHVKIDNNVSINLLEKCGFEFECIRKSFIKEDNLWTDRKIYTKIL